MSDFFSSSVMARQARLTLKEFRETLRDRRTIGTLLLMPILVYPLLSLTFQRLLLPTATDADGTISFQIAFESEADAERFNANMQAAYMLEDPEQRKTWPQFEVNLAEDLNRVVADGSASLGIRYQALSDGAPGRFILLFQPDPIGWQALAEVETRLNAVNIASLRRQLERQGRPAPLPAESVRQVVQAQGGTSPLATLVPLILILMTITGAVYPAIDLTAGERERGTLETLIASPAPRLALLLAKYAAVVSVAVLTATVNLLAMTVTIYVAGLGPLLFGESGLSLAAVVQVFALLILFAAFFAAILLSMTSVARSFKEAQAYLIPLMLVSIAPGLFSLMPGVELTPGLATIPLVNIVLLARDTFQGATTLGPTLIAVATTVLYSLAGIGLAARVFGGDAILYGSTRTWSDLWHRSPRAEPVVSASTASLTAALLFPAQFVLGGIAARLDAPMSTRLAAAALSTFVLFAGLPLLLTGRHRAVRTTALRLALPPWTAWPAAVLLGVSLWPLAHEVYQLGVWLGLATIGDEQLELARKLLVQWESVPLPLIVITLGVVPGLCEELFFRGMLFASWRSRLRPVATVVATALLFGLFHLVTPTVLATERLLPSTFMGLILGWVSLRTGSVLPGMLIHVTHNSLLLVLSRRLSSAAGDWTPGSLGTLHLPPAWLLASLAGTLLGLFMMRSKTKVEAEE